MSEITNWNQHAELFELLETAQSAILDSSARSGSHFILMNYLSNRYGLRPLGREAAMETASKLLRKFENKHSGISDDDRYATMADNW